MRLDSVFKLSEEANQPGGGVTKILKEGESIKKIRLRDSLTKIMGAPDVYLRSKVPEDMYDTL